jgi:hypothetical protein
MYNLKYFHSKNLGSLEGHLELLTTKSIYFTGSLLYTRPGFLSSAVGTQDSMHWEGVRIPWKMFDGDSLFQLPL